MDTFKNKDLVYRVIQKIKNFVRTLLDNFSLHIRKEKELANYLKTNPIKIND